MNTDFTTTPEEALCHLFFHCCFNDGKMTGNEIEVVSEKLVAAGLNKELNFKDEVIRYQSYRKEISDESAYFKNLITQIHPANGLALFSFCVELCLSDGLLQTAEESMLHTLSLALGLESDEEHICTKLMVQRKVAETENLI